MKFRMVVRLSTIATCQRLAIGLKMSKKLLR
jgi:hypothetical protein